MTTNFTALSLSDVVADFSAIATEATSVFGLLDERQLNWRPAATSWSVGQCFDHLLNANREMFQRHRRRDGRLESADRVAAAPDPASRLRVNTDQVAGAGDEAQIHGIAQGRACVEHDRPGIIERFAASQHEAAARIRSIERRDAASTIMVSPFVSFITYSVIDGCRLIVTHQRRHFEQARRVTQEPGFPAHG